MALKYFQDQKFRKKDGKPYGYKGIDAYQNSQARADYSMRSDDEEDDFELAELRKARNDASMQRLINSREYQDKQRQMRESAIELAKSKSNAGGDRITESRLSGITDYAKEHPLQVGATLAGSALKSGLERTTVGKAISLGIKGQELQKQASDYLTTGEKGETTEELLEAAKKRNAAYDENTKKLFEELKAAKQEYATQYDSSGYAYEEEAALNKIRDIENQLKASGLTDKDISQYEKDQDRINNAVAEEERKGRINEKLREGGKKGVANNVLYAAGDILSSTVSGFPAVANAIGAKIKGENVDTNSKAWTLANINKDIEEIQNDIIIESVDKQVGKKDSWQGQVAGYGYGVGMSTAKSLTAMGIGGSVAGAIGAEAGLSAEATTKLANAFTLPGFGANAAAESVREGQDRGLNSNQILATSLAAGFFEMFFEQFSLDHAWDIVKNNNPRVAKNMLVNLLVQGGIEGSEEGATDIANWIADYLINGKLSEYEQVLSETGSKRDTYLYFAKQLGLDMLAGFISGEVAGLGYSAANMHYQTKGGRAMFEDKEGMQDALENPQSPNYISPNEEDYESEEAYTQAIAARNELQKAVYNQKITGKQARSLFSDVQQAYVNKDKQQKSEFQSQTKTEEVEEPEPPAEEYQAPEKTQEEIISDIEFASTPYELAKALEYVEEETDEIKELVDFKRDELKMYGATDEQLDNVITPKKAFEMGQRGEEITEDQLASIPQNDRQEVLESNNQQYNKAILAEHKDAITDTKTGKYFVPSEVKVKGNEIVVVDSEGHEHTDFSSPKIKAANNAITVVSKDVRTGNNTGQSLYNVTVKQSADVTNLAIKSTEANSIQLNSAVKAIFQVASVGNRTWSAFENKYQYMFDVIDKEAAKTLFDQVRSDARTSDRVKTKGTAGKKTSNETVSKTLRENLPEETVALLEAFGNKIGYNFVASTNKEARGDILPSKRQISIGQNNLSEVYAITSHEGIAEYLQAHGNEDEVLDIQDTMLSYLQEKMGEEQYQNLINLYQSVYRTGAKSEIDANKSRRAAANEMFADTVWTLFASEEGLNDFVGWVTDTKTASEQVSIFTKIKDFFSKIYDAIRNYIEHGSFNEAEMAALEMDAKQAKDLRDRILKAMDHAIENAKASEGTGKEGGIEDLARHSFAGINSLTADRVALNLAKDMFKDGEDDLTILAATGWFKGADNRWKYEIPDNDAEIFKTGNAAIIRENNEDYRRYEELFNSSDWNDEELAEMEELEERLPYYEIYGEAKSQGKLTDFLNHDKLYDSYPFLRDINVSFVELPGDTRGQYDSSSKTILLNKSLLNQEAANHAIKSTMLHEIQHAIQSREGFGFGSSPEYWKETKESTINLDKLQLNKAKKNLEKEVEIAKRNNDPTSTKEFTDQFSFNTENEDEYWDALAAFQREFEVWKEGNIYKYEQQIRKLQRHIENLELMTDNELYKYTSGEVEARDVQSRLDLTAEERLQKMPNLEEDNVVYSLNRWPDDRRFSKKIDADYEHAVAVKDIPMMQHLVDEAAKVAGYLSPKLYHGTGSFGFTSFNLEKMDDRQTIFLTDNPNIASTYSGTTQRKNISQAFTGDIMKLTADDLAKELNASIPDDGISRSFESFNTEKLSELQQRNLENIVELKRVLNDIELNEDEKLYKTVESLKAIFRMHSYEEALEDSDIRKKFGTHLYLLANNAEFLDQETKDKLNAIEQDLRKEASIKDEIATSRADKVIVESDLDGYSFEVYTPAEARMVLKQNVNSGIYSLYAKLGSSLVIDCEGKNWNALRGWTKAYTDTLTKDNTHIDRVGNMVYLFSNKGENLNSLELNDFNEDFSDEEFQQHLLNTLASKFAIRNEYLTSTRDIVKFAKERGFDSVVFKNIKDNGGRNYKIDYDEIADVYAIFNPNNAKSADPVTYDDNGNVIPLSERFNDTDNDLRFSKKVDSEGRNLTKEQEAFFKNTKVLDENGNLKVVYHGTMANFTIFDLKEARDTEDIEAFFFSGDYDESNGYGNVGEYYLNITNPADYDTAYDIFFKYKGESGAGAKAREELEALGYDGVIAYDEDAPEYTEYLAFNSNQIKRIDNLNPTENDDVRYSKKVLLPDGREVKYLADVLNPREYNRLKEMIDSGYPAFNTKDGDAVYRLDNKLVYARGKENFGISRIVEANVGNDFDANKILDWVTDSEIGDSYDRDEQRKFITGYYGQEAYKEYSNADFGKTSRYDRPTKRGKSRSDAYHAQREQNRRRVYIKDEQLVDDIRKSIKVYGEASPYADSINETKTITALIGSMNNALSKADVFEVPNDELIRIERYINNKYKVEGIEEGEIAANVAYTFAYMQKNKLDTDYEVMMNYLLNIGDEVIKHSNLKDPETEKIYQDTRAQLMSHKIKLTDADRAEISNAFGGSWKEAFGALQKAGIRLDNKNGVSIDSIFSEIKQEVLESAGIDISYGDKPSEQILALIDTMTALEPTAYLWDGANDMDKALTVVTDIVQQYYTTATEQLESNVVKGTQKGKDALKKAVEKEKARLRGEWSKYKSTKTEEFNELVAEKNQVIQQQQNEIKRQNELLKTWEKDMAQKDKELNRRTTLSDKEIKATARLQAKQAVQSYKDRQERAKQIENIKKTGIRLIKWLTNPSDTQHVPQFLQKPLGEFLAAIDFLPKNPKADSKSTLSWHQRMNGLREELIRIKNSEDEGNNDVRAYFAQNIVAKELISMMDDFLGKEEWDEFTQSYILTKRKASKVSSLDAKDLATLNKIMSALSASINNLNKTYANDQFKEISKLAKESVKEVDSLPAKKDMQKLMGQVFNFLNFDELEPITYFEGLGKGAKSVFDELRAGFNLKTKHVRESDEYMAKAKEELGISDKELSTWKNQVHKFNLVEGTVMLNTTQIMSLYETLKRKQGKPHVAVGGIKAADFEYKDGKIMKKHHQAKAVHIMSSEAQAIIDTLTDEQKALADKMQQYMASECASWGNRVTEKMYGYKKYEEEDYFPLRTDAHSRATTASSDNNVSYYTIKNASFTKPITPMANNAVVLEDIFDVFTDHVVSMADYDAYVMPIADAMRWFNYSERMINAVAPDELNEQGARMDYIGNMQESIDRVYGDAGLNYFRQFIKDINGDYAGRGGKSEILTSLMSMYKAQAVGANIRVVVQQPTAVVRALDVIEKKYLLQAMASLPKATEYAKKAQANSEIAYWKAQGYYETYLGQSFKEIITGDTTFKDRMNDWSGYLAGKADDLSWGIMYHAAELKVKDTMSELKEGTAAFDAAATKIFEEIVDHTQVVDTIFHKSQWMRSQELGHKVTSAFMAEPTKTYNMLYRAYRDAKLSGNRPYAIKRLRDTALIFLFEQLLNAIITGAVDMLRDDEKKNYISAFKEHFSENALDNLNPLNLLPIAKEITSAIQGYDATAYTTDAIYTAVDSFTALKKIVTGESKKTTYGNVYQIAKAVSQLTGVPVANVIREFKTIYNNVNDFWGGKDLVTTQDKANKIAKTKESKRLNEVFATNDLSTMKAEVTNTYTNALQSGKSEADAWKASRDMLKEQYLVMIAEHPEDKAAINNRFKTLLKYTKQSDGKGGMRDMTDKEIANRIEGWMNTAE